MRAVPGLTPDGAAGDEGGTVFDAGLKYLEAVNGNVLVYPSFIAYPFTVSASLYFHPI